MITFLRRGSEAYLDAKEWALLLARPQVTGRMLYLTTATGACVSPLTSNHGHGLVNKNLGILYALAAYLLWGVFPLYWKQLEHISSEEIIVHRMIWAAVMLLGYILLARQWSQLQRLFSVPATLGKLAAASLFISLNWGIFIWAVNNGYILEISLGYFINPLVNVLFGALFFKERFTLAQILALAIATLGVLILIVHSGGLPLVSLSLAFSFSIYGALKKQVSVPASHGLAVELLLVMLPALLFLLYWQTRGEARFLASVQDSLYLIIGGLLTVIPLLFFAAAAKRVSLATLGMTQYLGPTLHLIIAVLIYKEPFDSGMRYAFSCIWIALLIYSFEGQLNFRRNRLRLKNNKNIST